MKNKLFNFKLYVEALKRLRIIGIAVAILCVTVSALIPVYHMANMSPYDYYDYYDYYNEMAPSGGTISREAIENEALVIPALVASYLMPLFVFFIYSYLNKRNESDFYHAIPFTRGCVYTSTTLATLSWSWGILIASCLVAGTLWAIDPYASFSFGGLLLQMLYMCLNATLLISAASVAVSLMGTTMTGVISFAVILCLWRYILGMAMETLDAISNLVDAELLWGGYLHPNFLLPVGLATGEQAGIRPIMLIYAVLVSLALFALGGWLYRIRRSETAGRSVPGKWLQVAIRCLISLPTAILLVYLILSGEADLGTTLIVLVATLLIFYLYELLTTRSVRRMGKATPWLGVLLAAALSFGLLVGLGNVVVMNENVPAERITAVGVDNSLGVGGVELSLYEYNKLGDYMTENDEAAEIAARALKRAQEIERDGQYYYDGDYYNIYSSYSPATMGRVWMDIRLVGGRTITRRVMIEEEEYARLLEIIREDADITPVPLREEVKRVYVQLFRYHSYQMELSGDVVSALIPVMEQEWRMMDTQGKANFIAYNKYDGASIELRMNVRFPGERYDSTCYYFIDPEDMPLTYALLSGEIVKEQPARDNVETMLENILADEDGVVYIAGVGPSGEELDGMGYTGAAYYADVVKFLLERLDCMVPATDASKGLEGLTVLHIVHEGYAVYDAYDVSKLSDTESVKKVSETVEVQEPLGYGYNDFVLVLELDKDEREMLWSLLMKVGNNK